MNNNDNRISFAIDNAELVKEDPNSSFSILSLDFFADGPNKHDYFVTTDTLLRTANTIKNLPLVWKYDKMLDDAASHHPEEVACGFIPESAEITSKKLEDGRTMLSVISFVWKRFSGHLLDFFKRDGDKPISVEMSVFESRKRDDGLTELLDYKFEAVTILGSLIQPAIPMAHATVLQFAEEYKEAVELEFGKYDIVDFRVPTRIKKIAQETLDAFEQKGISATNVALAVARHLINSEKASPEKIREIAKRNLKNDESDGFYGGEAGLKWAKKVAATLDMLDNQTISYFGEYVTFPYEKREDMNPALKGIDPSISVAQGNQIARQAEAIGNDDEKNGWAIAISQFKKTHEVKDGKWVKKEKSDKKEEMSVTEEEKQKLEEEEKIKKEKELQMAADEEAKKKAEEEETARMAAEEEEKKKKDEEEEENRKKEFSLALAAFEGSENFEALSAEFAKPFAEMNYAVVMGAVCKKMAQMKDDCDKHMVEKEEFAKKLADEEEKSKAYMAENEELRKFKAEKEREQFDFAVDSTLKTIEEKTEIPGDELENLREKAKEFSLETLEAWKNMAKARALDFAVKDKKNEDGVRRIALPFSGETRKNNGSPWSR